MNIIELNHIDLNSIGLNSKVINGVGKLHGGKVKPYIKGHVTDGSSTFTFKVNGNDVTVSVSGGDWKYKPTAVITSLAFVGVPQLESLELNKITRVSTFNLDYPVVPVFKKCDATTEAALNYVYHIRGTATANFAFTLTYVDESTDETEAITHNVTVSNNKWDVAYSGKRIYGIDTPFYDRDGHTYGCTEITGIEFTDDMSRLLVTWRAEQQYRQFLYGLLNATYIKFAPNTKLDKITSIYNAFGGCSKLVALDLPDATFENATSCGNAFNTGNYNVLQTIRLTSLNSKKSKNQVILIQSSALENLYIAPNSNNFSWSFPNTQVLSEQSVVNLFNAVAADGITLTFHPTVFAMIEGQLEIEDSPIYEAYWNSDYDFNYASA